MQMTASVSLTLDEMPQKVLVDLDECATNNGGCNQTCVNEIGSYHCSCIQGYSLDEDGLGCSGIIIIKINID